MFLEPETHVGRQREQKRRDEKTRQEETSEEKRYSVTAKFMGRKMNLHFK